MPDREKVIRALECCKRKDGNECKVCPYTESEYCTEDMVTDALALLKEQEEQLNEQEEEIKTLIQKAQNMIEGIVATQYQVVTCENCKYGIQIPDCNYVQCALAFRSSERHDLNWFCADGKHK